MLPCGNAKNEQVGKPHRPWRLPLGEGRSGFPKTGEALIFPPSLLWKLAQELG